jgi:very-short-patch-repair endonuclease
MSVLDTTIAALAARQQGVIARRQLLAAGLSASAIDRRIADSRLVALHRGVYLVGVVPPRREANWMGAVLAIGPGAVLSHRSAAALRELRRTNRSAVDVIVRKPGRRSRPGITVHVTGQLHPDDRCEINGIPVTSVARTLLDLAEVVPPIEVQRAFERAEELRALDVRAVHELLDRSPGRRGIPVLRELVGYDPSAAADAASELERLFLDLIRAASLPEPQVNVLVEGFLVDAYWPQARLVVELDGYAFHRRRREFERDRERITTLQLQGYTVLPFTYAQVTRRPEWVLRGVREALQG